MRVSRIERERKTEKAESPHTVDGAREIKSVGIEITVLGCLRRRRRHSPLFDVRGLCVRRVSLLTFVLIIMGEVVVSDDATTTTIDSGIVCMFDFDYTLIDSDRSHGVSVYSVYPFSRNSFLD